MGLDKELIFFFPLLTCFISYKLCSTSEKRCGRISYKEKTSIKTPCGPFIQFSIEKLP